MYYKNKHITINRLLRKVSSIFSLFINKCRTHIYRIKFLISGVNITFGKNVSIGRMVTVKTPDEGKIIIGNNVTIADFVVLFAENAEIRIGDNTGAEIGTQIIAIKSVTIGEFCLIAAYCVIRDMNHGMDISVPMALQKQEADPIVIGNDVWLGSHVVVTAGSKIGNGSVIGANAVVTSNIPAGAIAVGVPAKVVRLRGEIQK